MTDAQATHMGEALYALRDLIAAGWEYPDAEHRIATRFKVKHSDLREAYDEFTSVPHDPEEYL